MEILISIAYPEHFAKADEAAAIFHPEDWKDCPKDGFNSGGCELGLQVEC